MSHGREVEGVTIINPFRRALHGAGCGLVLGQEITITIARAA
jgi:hypothetical protein